MIVAIKIRNYKGIKDSRWLNLDSFHVLVGPNGSGKSTFLDAIEFVRSCLIVGPLAAVEERVPEYRDLTFLRQGGPIEFDLRLRFPDLAGIDWGTLEYRLALETDERLNIGIREELLSRVRSHAASLLPKERTSTGVRLLGKTKSGSDFYSREKGAYTDSFQFGPGKLALALTPPDIQKYPTGNRVKDFLTQGVRYVQLNAISMRQPSAATRSTELELDGTNLLRVVGSLLRNGANSDGRRAIERWTEHLRYALEDLESIGWAARQPDNAEYLVLKFAGGLECRVGY